MRATYRKVQSDEKVVVYGAPDIRRELLNTFSIELMDYNSERLAVLTRPACREQLCYLRLFLHFQQFGKCLSALIEKRHVGFNSLFSVVLML